jgi:hypothetical protein
MFPLQLKSKLVNYIVPLLSESIVAPLTQHPTEQQRLLKQEQIKAKGVSRGPSKLLSKFMPEEHRKVSIFVLI